MPDLIPLLTIALLFPLSILYVFACDHLKFSRAKGTQS
jgi:hypothetical protein